MNIVSQGVNLVGGAIKNTEEFVSKCVEATGEFPNFGVFSGDKFIFKSPDFKLENEDGKTVKDFLINCKDNETGGLILNYKDYQIMTCENSKFLAAESYVDGEGSVYCKSTPNVGTILIAYDRRKFSPSFVERFESFAEHIIGTKASQD